MASEVNVKITINKQFLNILLSSAEKGLMNAGQVLESKAKQLAPVWTGALKKDIRITKVNRNKIRVGSDLIYAYPKEFGMVQNNGRIVSAKPYMRPAFAESRERMMRAFIAAGKGK